MNTFPVLYQHPIDLCKLKGLISSVPWSFVFPHKEQALRNHGQSLECLANRGGLSPAELLAVVEDRKFSFVDDNAALAALKMRLDEGKIR